MNLISSENIVSRGISYDVSKYSNLQFIKKDNNTGGRKNEERN